MLSLAVGSVLFSAIQPSFLQAQSRGSEPRATPLPTAPSSLEPANHGRFEHGDDQLSLLGFPKRVLLDEVHVVTSPARLREQDLKWLLPLAGASAAAFATDTRAMRDVVTYDRGINGSAGTASDVLRDGFIGAPIALFALGELAKAERPREAGLLAGESMVDAYAFGAVVKVITLRERPSLHNAGGAFFRTDAGWDSSFPSGHVIVAWSSAAALAGAYNRPWQQIALYSLASGVSFTRVLGRDHFPSDALVGSAAGWLIGHYVYKAHHRISRHLH